MSLTQDTLAKLLQVAPDDWGRLWGFLAQTGCRRGEALALTGAQIDREPTRDIVRVEPHTTPEGRVWAPKTSSGIRSLVLPPGTVPPALPSAYVFVPSVRRPVHNTTADRALNRQCAKAGIARVTSHDFRRMRITQALMAGAEPVALSRAVGHRSLATTIGYLRELPMLCELPPLDAEPVANTAGAAWAQTLNTRRTHG